MSIPRVKFANNDEAAHAIRAYLRDCDTPLYEKFALRPYNRFATDFTEWWLIPGKAWPAYYHSKLFVHRFQPLGEEDKRFYTGFYVEKGLGKQLAGMPEVNRAHIMQDDWYWHQFIRHAKAGDMSRAIAEVLQRSQRPVLVLLNSYEFNHAPQPDEERHAPHDWVEFAIRSPSGDFQLAHRATRTLVPLNTCANLPDLAQRLEIMKDLDFFWLDLMIGIRLQYGSETSGN